MFKNLTGMAQLLRHSGSIAQRIQEVREQLAAETVKGAAGADMIHVEVNGLGEVLRLRIADELYARDDHELLEELIVVAMNDALTKVRKLHIDKLREATGGIEIPGLDDAISGL